MRPLNPAETEALVRLLDGLEDYHSVELWREDSFGDKCWNGFLVVEVTWNTDGSKTADIVSETGVTSCRAI